MLGNAFYELDRYNKILSSKFSDMRYRFPSEIQLELNYSYWNHSLRDFFKQLKMDNETLFFKTFIVIYLYCNLDCIAKTV